MSPFGDGCPDLVSRGGLCVERRRCRRRWPRLRRPPDLAGWGSGPGLKRQFPATAKMLPWEQGSGRLWTREFLAAKRFFGFSGHWDALRPRATDRRPAAGVAAACRRADGDACRRLRDVAIGAGVAVGRTPTATLPTAIGGPADAHAKVRHGVRVACSRGNVRVARNLPLHAGENPRLGGLTQRGARRGQAWHSRRTPARARGDRRPRPGAAAGRRSAVSSSSPAAARGRG